MGAADNDKSSELGRGSSLRASVRFSTVQGDDDDYDLQAMGIADGFRPAEVRQNDISRPLTATPQDSSTTKVPPPRPSSITKPHHRNESLTLQHDGSTTTTESESPDSDRTHTRSSTASTTSPFMDHEDPYDGPSGPSHPYQMYPQGVRVARTASLATTSTAPISERSYNGPRGPAHPYGMYPQNTIPESSGMSSRAAQDGINIGFPGTTDNYQRRIGPDGEEAADLIGPDGHTEQLPPYTRYPEETYDRKALGLPAVVPTPQPAPAQPMLDIPGAGGIGVATRNPEFPSTEDLGDLNSPESRQSVRSFTSEGSQRELTNTNADAEIRDEKNLPKGWQVTAKRRVWGIVPCWAIILAGFVLVAMGIILGAVIGTLVNPHYNKKGHPPDGSPSPLESPNSWDTQPLSDLPSDLPPLPEGMWAMPLGRNSRISNTCFTDPTLAQAWGCDLSFSQLFMTVKRVPGQSSVSNYAFDFTYNETYSLKNNVYSYGVQPPDLTGLNLKLVGDIYEGPRGPAWNFEVTYNKTIILHEPALSVPSGSPSANKNRRMMFGGDFMRKGIVAQPGEKPWICHWDNTILEGFIYAGQNNSYSRPFDPGPTTNVPTSSGGDFGGPSATPAPGGSGGPGDSDGSDYRPSQGPPPDAQEHFTSAPGGDNAPASTSAPASASTSGAPDPPMPFSPVPPYPRVIKVEERRSAAVSGSKPWCRQYQITGDHDYAVPVLDENKNTIDVYIDEDEGDEEPGQSRRSIAEPRVGRRNSGKGSDMSECGCIWWLS
ncbi:hypothetical protein M426DRAFT_81661 [Hypoxylon sp. CI-4A]|nr:hypothetical protein M426DRAFT_81661 [Hypoxylon sp. CI-4A]